MRTFAIAASLLAITGSTAAAPLVVAQNKSVEIAPGEQLYIIEREALDICAERAQLSANRAQARPPAARFRSRSHDMIRRHCRRMNETRVDHDLRF